MNNAERVTGWWIFAGILLAVSGVLNIIWGIAAISESHFFVGNTQFIISELKTWGWITLILGIAQGIAALSLFAGGEFGRWFGVLTAGLVAIAALMDIAAYPLWSICVFGLSLLILYELVKSPESQTAR